eukprot:m51a1_g2195 putative C-tail anchored protein, emp24/gp25L/p24 family/GOLD (201) ;mRNA; r:135489-136421
MRPTAVILALACAAALGRAFVVTVEPHGVECFKEDVPKDEGVMVMYQVLSGGHLDIDFEVTNPSGGVVVSGARESEGRYDFRAEQAGIYRFCWNNQMSSVTHKTISISIDVGDEAHVTEFALRDDMNPLEQSVYSLSQGVQDIKHDQEYMYMRDVAHKSINDSTNSRVLYWFMFEALLIVLLASWQVIFIRRIFESKRAV